MSVLIGCAGSEVTFGLGRTFNDAGADFSSGSGPESKNSQETAFNSDQDDSWNLWIALTVPLSAREVKIDRDQINLLRAPLIIDHETHTMQDPLDENTAFRFALGDAELQVGQGVGAWTILAFSVPILAVGVLFYLRRLRKKRANANNDH